MLPASDQLDSHPAAEARQQDQAIPYRQAPEPQSLLLDGDVEVLGGELPLELALEVVEQAVPPHCADFTGLGDRR